MKKTVFLTAMIIGFLVVFAGTSSAIIINTGAFGGKYTDVTYADLDYPLVTNGIIPNPVGGTQSGNVWGLVSMTGIYSLLDGNPENNALSGVAYYTPGSDGKYYFGVYGGLTYLSGTVPGQTRYGAATGITPYLKIYETTDPTLYDKAVLAGPNVAGLGAFGTFGLDIITGSTLWLDTTFSPGTLAAYDLLFQPGELELITNSSSVTGSAEAYLDILGGTGAYLFQTGIFPLGNPAFPDRADLKVISDLTSTYNTTTQTWNSPFGWTTNSQDPITGVGVIPEPSTILLLGAGLLGLGLFGKRRMKK